ncbi:MAG TPA: ABC transporter ATP-binding protein [Candidatus Binataceae bacterium]|nr:ABC transporter ATP-binding protein [Candidatus Binataceae bacterium]
MAAPPILEAIEISKYYGQRLAVDNVTLAVRRGEIAALLGPNGAGKTTTLSILATLLRPDRGRILIDGKSPKDAVRRTIGLIPQSLALYPTLSVAQNVWHFARMQGLSRKQARESCSRVLEEVGLGARAHDAMHALSGGMKRLLNLACGIVHQPPALMLDEPTVGVDLQSRERILSSIRRYAENGAAVIYSTHYMEEAERICDRVLLIDRGKLIAEGSLEQVVALGGGKPRVEITYRGRLPNERFARLTGVHEIAAMSSEGKATLEMNSLAQFGDVLDGLRGLGLNVIDFMLHSPNLSDAFIALTGRELRDQVQ